MQQQSSGASRAFRAGTCWIAVLFLLLDLLQQLCKRHCLWHNIYNKEVNQVNGSPRN